MKTKILYAFFFFCFTSTLHSNDNANFIQAQYEKRDFKNSAQKTKGDIRSIQLQHTLQNHKLKVAYDITRTTTKEHIPKDLRVEKIYARYTYDLNKEFNIYTGYIHINDNLVSTDGGQVFSLGLDYNPTKKLRLGMASYYGKYDIMKTYQLDVYASYKTNFSQIKSKSLIMTKQINIRECQTGAICSKAKSSYLTLGLKQSFKYESYMLRMGTFLGKRTFAVMQDGFRVQHHAMEINKTIFMGLGKSFSSVDVNLNYIYQEATELPSQTKEVEIRNIMISLKYRY